MKKKILIIACILIVAVLGITAYSVSKMPAKNANGWETTENSLNDAEWGSEIESSLDYHVEKVKKSDFKKMSDFEYIDTVKSVLNAYNDKVWVLFLFEDGTGIQYPGADAAEKATYGKFDKNYNATEQIGYVTINGNSVQYEKVPSEMNKESNNLSQAIPDTYKNDYTYVNVKNNIAYIQVLSTNEDTQSIANEIVNTVKGVGDYKEIRFCIKYNQDLNYYKWTADGSMETITTPDNSFFVEPDESLENKTESE